MRAHRKDKHNTRQGRQHQTGKLICEPTVGRGLSAQAQRADALKYEQDKTNGTGARNQLEGPTSTIGEYNESTIQYTTRLQHVIA